MGRFSHLNIGVLALQGDYELHQRQLAPLGAASRRVKLPHDLAGIDGLILPGGESTTMDILIDRFGLRRPLLDFCTSRPVYGTCAGMILLSKRIEDNTAAVLPLGILDIDVLRNGYGRQKYSFEETLSATLDSQPAELRGAFIRAPKVTRLGNRVRALAFHLDTAVLVSQGRVLAASFHAEVSEDARLLSYFLRNFVGDSTALKRILHG